METRKFSLRGHKAPVSCVASYRNDIVSADRDGWVVWWNLRLKRPHALWQAHTAPIITLESTHLGLVTHGKDSAVRIWNLETAGAELARDVSAIGTECPKPLCYEIPVNSLNFCNVALSGGLLATPGTRDSDAFDIYKVTTDSLQRVVENYGLESQSDGTKRSGNGIVMRLLLLESLLFVGYESGAVQGYRLKNDVVSKGTKNDRLILNKDTKVSLVFDEKGHSPLPILTLKYDFATQKLYTGSALKKLIVNSLSHLMGGTGTSDPEPQVVNLKHAGIQSVDVGRYLAVGFWDGVVKGYTDDFEEVFRLERPVEQIQPEHESESEIGKANKKSLCLHIWTPPPHEDTNRRALRKMEELLFVGYGDGLISAFGA